jgi:hypothetical protein
MPMLGLQWLYTTSTTSFNCRGGSKHSNTYRHGEACQRLH